MRINFVTATLKLNQVATSEELSSNEYVLLQALFLAMNERKFPDGMVGITNNQILVYTTFAGSKRDETLRQTRAKLVERGLIEYTQGVAYKSRPEYRICWERMGITPEDAPEDTPQDTPKKRGISGGYINTKTETERKTETDTRCSVSPDENTHTSFTTNSVRAREVTTDNAWRWSPRARGAVAQRILDRVMPELEPSIWVDMSGMVLNADDVYGSTVRAMAAGITPDEITKTAEECRYAYEFDGRLQLMAIDAGASPPDDWIDRRDAIITMLEQERKTRYGPGVMKWR